MSAEIVARLDAMLRGFEPAMPRSHLMTYAEAAVALGVSTNWLKSRVAQNEIPCRKVGVYVRFTGDDIEEIQAQMGRGGEHRSKG